MKRYVTALLALLTLAPMISYGEADVIELERTVIFGNRESLKVLSIVPWKKSPLDEKAEVPDYSVSRDVLEFLDRDVFKRQVRYLEGDGKE